MNKLVELYNSIAADKKLHLGAGLVIGLAFGASPLLALGAVVLAGVGKEVYDFVANKYMGTNHDVSVYDALATGIGGVVGILVVSVVHLIVGKLV